MSSKRKSRSKTKTSNSKKKSTFLQKTTGFLNGYGRGKIVEDKNALNGGVKEWTYSLSKPPSPPITPVSIPAAATPSLPSSTSTATTSTTTSTTTTTPLTTTTGTTTSTITGTTTYTTTSTTTTTPSTSTTGTTTSTTTTTPLTTTTGTTTSTITGTTTDTTTSTTTSTTTTTPLTTTTGTTTSTITGTTTSTTTPAEDFPPLPNDEFDRESKITQINNIINDENYYPNDRTKYYFLKVNNEENLLLCHETIEKNTADSKYKCKVYDADAGTSEIVVELENDKEYTIYLVDKIISNTKKVKIKQSEQQNYPLMYNEEFMEFTQANIDFEYDINSNTKRYNLEFKTDEDTSNNIFVIPDVTSVISPNPSGYQFSVSRGAPTQRHYKLSKGFTLPRTKTASESKSSFGSSFGYFFF